MNTTAIRIPEFVNYIGVFLTYKCNFNCPYCINNYNTPTAAKNMLSGAEFIEGLNRIESRDDLPVSIQGGEPSLHPDFYEIINNIKPSLRIDILTNLQFDVLEFINKIKPERLARSAPYSPIRVSFHPLKSNSAELISKTLILQNNGFKVGIYGLDLPEFNSQNTEMRNKCMANNIDFRYKEFLGYHNGKLYGTYKYPDAIAGKLNISVKCAPSELLINPAGDIFKCHYHLYSNSCSVGNILSDQYTGDFNEIDCFDYGLCNPCDVKIKTDRYQIFGHTSVRIEKNVM